MTSANWIQRELIARGDVEGGEYERGKVEETIVSTLNSSAESGTGAPIRAFSLYLHLNRIILNTVLSRKGKTAPGFFVGNASQSLAWLLYSHQHPAFPKPAQMARHNTLSRTPVVTPNSDHL